MEKKKKQTKNLYVAVLKETYSPSSFFSVLKNICAFGRRLEMELELTKKKNK